MPDITQEIDKFTAASDDTQVDEKVAAPEDTYEPQYRMLSNNRIPVSKKHGTIWKTRRDAGIKKVKDDGHEDRWSTALEYFRADHQDRRDNSDIATDKEIGTRLTTKGKESENIVFANTTSLVPSVYAKNPTCEISCIGRKDLEPWANAAEKLINVLIGKRTSPGVNLKPIARRAVIMATLTNSAWVEVGYTRKEQSNENTMLELNQIGAKLAASKDKKEIMELEAKLVALEDKVDVLRDSGPFIKFRRPQDVIVDPDATAYYEAKWIMIREFVPTEMLKVVYGTKNEDGKYESIFEPSHILKLSSNGGQDDADEIANFSFIKDGAKTFKDYGYDDEEAFSKAQRTEVWYVWDKATRRVYMYNNADWKWPLWVWDDPSGFDDFFPLEPLEFYTDPEDMYARSEVMYYLDQQDSLNIINNEFSKTRDYIVGKVIYNKRILGDNGDEIIDSFIAGTTRKRSLGVDLDPQLDLNKLFVPMMPASAHMLNTAVFDKQKLIEAVDRVSSVTNVMRGVEYKTNTTNRAIESYESGTQTRLDEKIDAIEDFIGGICWRLLQLCVKFMPDDTVTRLIGSEDGEIWKQQKPQITDLGNLVSVRVVGGSTLKPTSNTKKQQAAQLGQILGQFARGTPAAVIVALKVMERAYDEVIISKEDWQMISQSVMAQINGPQPAPNAEGGDKKSEGGGNDQAAADPMAAVAELERVIDSLPLQLKQELAKMLASNVPVKQAMATVVQSLQGLEETSSGAVIGA